MCGSEALAWELRGRGGREWRHIEERRRVRERGRERDIQNDGERDRDRKEANAKKRKMKDEGRFRKGNEAVEQEGEQQSNPLAL